MGFQTQARRMDFGEVFVLAVPQGPPFGRNDLCATITGYEVHDENAVCLLQRVCTVSASWTFMDAITG